MNKRNTYIAILVLIVLVALLIGKSVRHHNRVEMTTDMFTNKVDYLLDLNLASGFDSATVNACDLPIVIHYPKLTNVNGSRTQLHVFSLSTDVLKGLAQPGKGGIMPDSTQGIHIYPKFLSSRSTCINLGFYNKVSMHQEVEYRVTYPVNDSIGKHVVEDSGLVSSEMNWKTYGIGTKEKNRKESEVEMTKQLEHSLIKDVAGKIQNQEK